MAQKVERNQNRWIWKISLNVDKNRWMWLIPLNATNSEIDEFYNEKREYRTSISYWMSGVSEKYKKCLASAEKCNPNCLQLSAEYVLNKRSWSAELDWIAIPQLLNCAD